MIAENQKNPRKLYYRTYSRPKKAAKTLADRKIRQSCLLL